MNGGWFLGLDPCAEIMRDTDGKPAEEYTILRAPFATFLEVILEFLELFPNEKFKNSLIQ